MDPVKLLIVLPNFGNREEHISFKLHCYYYYIKYKINPSPKYFFYYRVVKSYR